MSSHLRAVRVEDPGDEAESALVERSLSGDREAFARLYGRYRRAVFAVSMAQLRDPVLAEDVVQDTFERALGCLDRFDTKRRMLPWLFTIAVNRCVSLRRGDRAEPADPTHDPRLDRSTGDATVNAVLREQDRAELERALATLPPRQRRALLLYALEGWNYADIASAEGASLLSIKSLIFRARTHLRAVCEAGASSFAIVPLRWLRRKAEVARLRTRLPAWTTRAESALAAGLPSVSVGFFALVLALTGAVSGVAPGEGGPRAGAAEKAFAASNVGENGGTVAVARAPQPEHRVSLTDLPGTLPGELLDPTGDADPDETQVSSITPSPAYASDHTVFAAGTVPCRQSACSVLFRSTDGGATWSKLRANHFSGQTLVLPPNYPEDDRIFAMGVAGLQVSTNGGASFTIANPLSGGVAISPAFGSGDPRILIGGTSIVEYWADKGAFKPAPIPVVSRRWSDVAFSPDYRADGVTDAVPDGVIIVGGARPSGNGMVLESVVYRCDGSQCARTTLDRSEGTPSIRLSSTFARDGVAYAFTSHEVYASADGARSFTKLNLPPGVAGDLLDVFAPPVTPRTPAGLVFAASMEPGPSTGGILRSTDGGKTWEPARIIGGNFSAGTRLVVAAQTGRLFAASQDVGMACSDDGGATWSRCTVQS